MEHLETYHKLVTLIVIVLMKYIVLFVALIKFRTSHLVMQAAKVEQMTLFRTAHVYWILIKQR